MRELKFRVWDIKNKKFIYEYDACHRRLAISFNGKVYHGGADDVLSDSDYIVQQYTGLKDRNGKEIYEGDILYRSQADSCWKVEYQAEEAAFILLDRYNETWGFLALRHNSEIVGNIFENPELLK